LDKIEPVNRRRNNSPKKKSIKPVSPTYSVYNYEQVVLL
jgi:hypothetical protein